ncbi:MAG: phosphohistidine phosphatase [Rhodothermales bacterium]|jgi:phosphohistidine phosphatase
MKILVMRHGAALPRQAAGVDYDVERPLAQAGSAHSRKVGATLFAAGLVPETVIASPAVRTQTTAELVCRQFPEPPQIIPVPELMSGSGSDELLRNVSSHATGTGWTLAVMHEPDISYVLGMLLFAGRQYPFMVNPGDIFGLQVNTHVGAPRAELTFLYSPSAS